MTNKIKVPSLKAPVAPKTPEAPVAPVAPAVSPMEAAKTAFVSGLKVYSTAKDTLAVAFNEARRVIIGNRIDVKSLIKLRNELIAWGEAGGLVKKTVGNVVSGLMLKAGIPIRHKPSKEVKATATETALADSILEYLTENATDGTDAVTVLKLALEQAKAAAKAGDEEPVVEEAAA